MEIEQNKIETRQLKRPKKKAFPFEITSEENPGIVVQLTLVEPTITRMLKIPTMCQEKINFYLVPDDLMGECPSLMPVDGEVPELTEDKIQLACAVFCLQDKPVYSFEDIINLMDTMEAGMLKVISKAKELGEAFEALMTDPFPVMTSLPPGVITIEEAEGT